MKKNVTIYTDGACSGNPGAGGWCAILNYNGIEKVISGGEADTTNNKMELLAIISGLEILKESCKVTLYSDSAYCINAFKEGWIDGWIKNGWKNSNNKEVKNVELWQRLLRVLKLHEVEFVKVKGHSDNEMNNRCDEIARGEIKKLLIQDKNT